MGRSIHFILRLRFSSFSYVWVCVGGWVSQWVCVGVKVSVYPIWVIIDTLSEQFIFQVYSNHRKRSFLRILGKIILQQGSEFE